MPQVVTHLFKKAASRFTGGPLLVHFKSDWFLLLGDFKTPFHPLHLQNIARHILKDGMII